MSLFKHHKFKDIDVSHHYFLCMISNPVMHESRYVLFNRFKDALPLSAGDRKLLTVEVAYGARSFEVESKYNLNLRTKDELWHKENALNLGIQQLNQIDPDWQYVTILDADIKFLYDDVEQKIVHALQHYDVIQPWSSYVDLGPRDEPIQMGVSYVKNYINGTPEHKGSSSDYYYYGNKPFWGHCGYAWSYRRSALNVLGGLFDSAILGSGDHHIAASLIGQVDNTVPHTIHPNYKKLLKDYESRALTLEKNIGFVEGGIAHMWHGKKAKRYYRSRWSILQENQYDPLVDIKRDTQGLLQLDCGDKLRDDIRAYFRSRDEDDKHV